MASQQSIPTTTFTALSFDTEDWDEGGYHEGVTNPSRLTVPSGKDGKHLIIFSGGCNHATVGRVNMRLYKNGSHHGAEVTYDSRTSYANQIIVALDLVAGDYIEVFAYQTSGSNQNTYHGGTLKPWLQIIKIDAASGEGSLVGASCTKTGSTSIPKLAWTAIGFDSEEFDTDTIHDNVTNNSRLTVPTGEGGQYLIFGMGHLDDLDAEKGAIFGLWKNGATLLARGNSTAHWAATNGTAPLARIVTLSAGDYIELMCYQDTTATQNAYNWCWIGMIKIDGAGPDNDDVGASATYGSDENYDGTNFLEQQLDTEDWDNGGYHDTVTNNERMTVPSGKAGKHLVMSTVGISNGAPDRRVELKLEKNGTTELAHMAMTWSQDANPPFFHLLRVEDMSEADYVLMASKANDASEDTRGTLEYAPRLQIQNVEGISE